MKGQFVISLDYELMWGVYDSMETEDYQREVEGVHSVLPKILDLFKIYNISSTVAFVGLLNHGAQDSVLESVPVSIINDKGAIPKTLVSHISNKVKEPTQDSLHFDRGILSRLVDDQNVELASHSQTHYYCQESHSSVAAFEEDMDLFEINNQEFYASIKSFVFPRNQFDNTHLAALYAKGFRFYRGNPNTYFHRRGNGSFNKFSERLVRFLDSYVPLSGSMTHELPTFKENELVNVPASLFLRPISSKGSLSGKFQLRRIKKSMTYAAVNGRLFHLWWHPHNFGRFQSANLWLLEEILKHYCELNNEYNFRSITMSQSARLDSNL